MIFDSKGCATVASSTSADAPGYRVVTSTWGGTMSGSCATGMRNRDSNPPSVMTIEMTIASRGRSMKTEEIMASAPAGDGRDRRRCYRRVGSRPLDALDNDLLSLLQAFNNGGGLRSYLAEAHAALAGDVVIIDHIHIAALLIGEDRGTRDGDDLPGRDGFQEDGNEFVCNELAKADSARRLFPQDRIWNDPADRDRIGALRDHVVDEIELAGLGVDSAVRKTKPDLHRLEAALFGILLAQLEGAARRHRKDDIHRVLADDRRQDT